MKLADIRGERAIEVVAELIDPIMNIAEDEQAAAFFKREVLPEGKTAKEYILERVRRTLPPLLKGHKKDLVAILAAINGVTPEEYAAKLDLRVLVADTAELLGDQVFLSFFMGTGAPSGGAPESTGGQDQ